MSGSIIWKIHKGLVVTCLKLCLRFSLGYFNTPVKTEITQCESTEDRHIVQ